MQFVELFAGVGGFHLGISQALQGGVCVYANEWDKYAAQTYSKNFKGEYLDTTDITNVAATDIPAHDCLVGGFPCQSFSIAGKRRGFEETRGTLFFEIARLLAHHRPRHLVLENVEGLLTHDIGKTFQTVLGVLADLGYRVEWQVLNSSNFGVPQSRKRVYIVGHLRDQCTEQILPIIGQQPTIAQNLVTVGNKTLHKKATANTIDANYHKGLDNHQQRTGVVVGGTLRTHNDGKGFRRTKDGLAPTLPARARDDGSGQAIVLIPQVNRTNGKREVTHTEGNIVPTLRATHYKSGDNQPKIVQRARGKNEGGEHDIAPTLTGKSYQDNNHVAIPVLTPDRPVKRQNGRRFKDDGDPAFTVNTIDKHGVYDGQIIRRLTPIECERLQGFPDNWTAGVSDSQRYKQMGNAVTVNVVKAIFERLNTVCKLNK